MTARFAHIHRLVSLRDQLRRNPDNIDSQMKHAIVDALPPGYRKIYDWIGTLYSPVNTAAVMKAWDLNSNHASTILNELWQFGLLTREKQVDSSGRQYLYRQAEKPPRIA